MSCEIRGSNGLVPSLLWLWHRLAPAALIWPLAWKLPCAAGEALKRKRKKKKKNRHPGGSKLQAQPPRGSPTWLFPITLLAWQFCPLPHWPNLHGESRLGGLTLCKNSLCFYSPPLEHKWPLVNIKILNWLVKCIYKTLMSLSCHISLSIWIWLLNKGRRGTLTHFGSCDSSIVCSEKLLIFPACRTKEGAEKH